MDYSWIKAWFEPGTPHYALTATEGWTPVEVLAVTLDDGGVMLAGEYQSRRASLYPPLTDQMDALGKIARATAAGETAPADAVAVMDAVVAVKDAIPKPPDPPWLRDLD